VWRFLKSVSSISRLQNTIPTASLGTIIMKFVSKVLERKKSRIETKIMMRIYEYMADKGGL